MKTTAILLATYNGKSYLKEQIDSLYAQTDRDWTLYIHDDGSTDGTQTFIEKCCEGRDNVQILRFPPAGGPMMNFLEMLRRVEADYYFFCDQDDVWMPDKIEVSKKRMFEIEAEHPGLPVVVHGDLAVVDESLKPLLPSFWKYEDIYPERVTSFEVMGVSNLTTGCAMLFNGAARDVTPVPPPPLTPMHDFWVTACVFRAGGIVSAIPRPLLYYRQHSGNCIGAVSAGRSDWTYFLSNAWGILRKNRRQYVMLKSLGYKSLYTYIKNKWAYKRYVMQKRRQSEAGLSL